MAARRALGAVVLTLSALSACSSSGTPQARTSSLYIPSFNGPGLTCGFVPTSAVRTIVGDRRYVAHGRPEYDSTGVLATCSVQTRDHQPLVTVDLVAPPSESNTTDLAGLREQIASAPRDWYVFPASFGVGFAAPRVAGDHHTGARTAVARGDYGLLAQVYTTGSDARAIALAVQLVRAIFRSLHIPNRVTSPAPSASH